MHAWDGLFEDRGPWEHGGQHTNQSVRVGSHPTGSLYVVLMHQLVRVAGVIPQFVDLLWAASNLS